MTRRNPTRALTGAVVVISLAWGAASLALFGASRIITAKPAVATAPVGQDADDPAIWVHPSDRTRSLIVGTDKAEGAAGALYVFNLQGKQVQRVGGLDRPNNVDIEQGVRLGGQTLDLAVAAERRAKRLRVFRVRGAAPYLTDITGSTRVFADAAGDASLPMGISLYHRRRDGALFAIVSRKSGPAEGHLGQYRLTSGKDGKVNARLVRMFGAFSGKGEIESVCVDDELGYVYYSDEGFGVRKYHADPDRPNAGKELAQFATDGYKGDHEGIAIMPTSRGRGYVISTEQIKGGSRYHVFTREGSPGKPHDHREVAVIEGGADDTDGIEAAPGAFGSLFPGGLLVVMNSKDRNFLLYAWPTTLK